MLLKPRYFKLEELVPQDLFELYKDKQDYLWWVFDQRATWTLDKIRMRYGKSLVNTWLWGGSSHHRGLRLYGSGIGAPLSQHIFGRAFDVTVVGKDSGEIRVDILENKTLDEFKFIRCLEIGVPHIHFDVRNWTGDLLLI